MTEISFDGNPAVTITENGKTKQPTKAEKEEILGGVVKTRKELEALLKEL